MGNSITAYADKIINICRELNVLLSNDGTFDAYKLKLLGKLQVLSLLIGNDDYREDDTFGDAFKKAYNEWRTTDDGNKVHFIKKGDPDKGNPHVLAAIKGAIDNAEARKEAQKKYPRKGSMVCEDKVEFEKPGSITTDKCGRKVTHINHDEDTMRINRPIKVEDDSGKKYKICSGTIEHLTVFAATGVGRGLDAANGLAEQVGGSPESWKHVKGIATVVDRDGNQRKADVHWFESPEAWQVEWKIKQFVDDMSERDKYWTEGA